MQFSPLRAFAKEEVENRTLSWEVSVSGAPSNFSFFFGGGGRKEQKVATPALCCWHQGRGGCLKREEDGVSGEDESPKSLSPSASLECSSEKLFVAGGVVGGGA